MFLFQRVGMVSGSRGTVAVVSSGALPGPHLQPLTGIIREFYRLVIIIIICYAISGRCYVFFRYRVSFVYLMVF